MSKRFKTSSMHTWLESPSSASPVCWPNHFRSHPRGICFATPLATASHSKRMVHMNDSCEELVHTGKLDAGTSTGNRPISAQGSAEKQSSAAGQNAVQAAHRIDVNSSKPTIARTPPGAAARMNTIVWSTAMATTWAAIRATTTPIGRRSSRRPARAGKNATPAPGSSSRRRFGMLGTQRGAGAEMTADHRGA